jgi:hypothetical protein
MTEHFGRRLKLAVNTTVTLFQTAWIPGHVEMEEIVAMRLKIDAFARGICGDEDADGMLVRGGLKGAFDGLAFIRGRRAVINFDAIFGKVGVGNGCAKHFDEVASRVIVFGEDEEA